MLSCMPLNTAANGAACPFATDSEKVLARQQFPAFRNTNDKAVVMRIVPLPLRLLLGLVALALLVSSCDYVEEGVELRVGAWNLEHLDDTGADGCVPREQADYDDIAAQLEEFGLDIVAFQEVENEAAAHRVFPESDWVVEVSRRPVRNTGLQCWGRPGHRLGHLATGFAIRREVAYRRNADLEVLGEATSFQRWGTDITVTENGQDLRLLSVHLASGCWGEENDADPRDERICTILRGQMNHLKAWADDRRAEGAAFVILGDFNRRLAVPGDWAWDILSPPPAPLHLPTSDLVTQCDPRFTEMIDHLVLGGSAGDLLVPGSAHEWPRQGEHPDHCAVSGDFLLHDGT